MFIFANLMGNYDVSTLSCVSDKAAKVSISGVRYVYMLLMHIGSQFTFTLKNRPQ